MSTRFIGSVLMSISSKLRSIHAAIYWSVFSGMAALIYQVVLQKVFSYVLGYALLSSTIVVAAYMLGLALGGFFVGLFCDKLSPRNCLSFYMLIEAGIGIFGLGSLIGYKIYLSALTRLITNPVFIHLMSLVPFRAALAMSALLPMTILMGATLPVLTLGVGASADQEGEEASARRVTITSLYSANLLGGLAGIVISAYFVLPYLGLWGAAILACFANFSIVVLILRFRSSASYCVNEKYLEPLPESGGSQTFHPEHASWNMIWFLSFASGLIMFALEILWTHLLAAVIGGTVFAFANMLFAVFVGLYLAAKREAKPESRSRTSLATLVLWGSILLALSVPFYAWSPFLFSALGLFSPGFIVRQVALAAVACFLIVPVALFLSRIFPRLLVVGVPIERKGRGVGFLLAINTFGCLLGLFLSNLVLIPVFGSQVALKGVAAVLGLIAWMVYRHSRKDNTAPAKPLFHFGFALTILFLVVLVAPWWPPRLLLSQRALYFGLDSDGEYKPLYYMSEDAEGGFVTVSGTPDGSVELRTNGKFQGNNSNQMTAQFSFGYLPALAAHQTNNAFVIGCGTGVTVRALADNGFKHITLVEISKSILYAARNYFHKENGGVLDDPRVTVIHDDGRNALALSKDRYDVISVELTSIWFAGAANLYSSDFYSIVHRKLVPGGVFQQWVQLHHMRLEDLYVVINTVHTQFKYVALWYSGNQGQILASDEPLSLDWERMRMLATRDAEARYISVADIYRIPYRVILDNSEAQQFVDLNTLRVILLHGVGQTTLPAFLEKTYLSQFIDNDLFPYLEYATPRGNAETNQELLNLAFLAQSTKRPTTVSFRDLPDADLTLAKALLAYRNGACDEVKQLVASGAVKLRPDESSLFEGCTPNYDMRMADLHFYN